MEILDVIWTYVAPIFGGISISGLISFVIYACLKGAFNRTINKINVEKISEQATEKGIEKVKKVSFNHSIQPIVESELKKIDEQVAKQFKAELKKVQENYDKLVNILEKLSAYFDGSIGVSEQAKAELKEAISNAKSEEGSVESVVESEVKIVESPKDEETKQVEPSKKPKNIR